MTSPSFNYFYRVEITAVQYTLGGIKNQTENVRELITRTYNFVNKELREAVTASDRETYVPILQSIGEVTLSAGEILPSVSGSSVVINDERGSFGADRRFSDILERFTIIDQDLNIYVGQSDTETDAPTSWTKIGGGTVKSWSKALSGNTPTMTVQFEPFKIADNVMNLEVSRDIIGMESAPQASLGKALPIVFNKVNSSLSTPLDRYPQVVPTRISADGASTAKYALTTQMYELTRARIQPNLYAKKAWEESGEVWANISFTTTAPDYTTPLVGTYYGLTNQIAKAHKLPEITATNNETGFIVTGVEIKMKGQSSTPSRQSSVNLVASILLVEKGTFIVVKQLAKGSAYMRNYDSSNNTGATFSVNICFDAPIIVELTSARTYDFYLAIESTGAAANDAEIQKYNTSVQVLTKPTGGGSSEWNIGGTESLMAHKLRIVAITSNSHESTYTKDGFTYSSLTMTQPSVDTGQSNPGLDSLQIVGLVEGFCKFYSDGGTTSGTASAYTASVSPAWTSYTDGQLIGITPHVNNNASATLNVNSLGAKNLRKNGSAIGANDITAGVLAIFAYNSAANSFDLQTDNARLYDPPTIVSYLSYDWDGESWSDISAVDTTTLASTHYTPLFTSGSSNHRARYLGGIIENKVTYAQAITEIARGSASKIGIFSNGKLFVHPWGVAIDPAYIIPQADIIPLSWETREDNSVINRTQITFEKYYATNINQSDTPDGFKYSIDFSSDTYLAVQQITEQSRSLFGAKNILENNFPVFGFSDTNPAVGLPGYLTGGSTASQPNSGGVVIYSVDFLADYYISRFSLPFVYCSFVVPYHRYKDIQMFDVVSFHHSEFPAFYGTDPAARPGVVDTGTTVTPVVAANYGEEFVRAQTYRGLVEAVSYVMAMEHAPAIRLTVQVLLNEEYDPT
ncbi:hypothetical protein EBZ39_05365 [bacterium]|nr:hypothetical protein [bacterium]